MYCIFPCLFNFIFAVFSVLFCYVSLHPSHPTLISQRTISQWANLVDSRQNREKSWGKLSLKMDMKTCLCLGICPSLTLSYTMEIMSIFETTLFVEFV